MSAEMGQRCHQCGELVPDGARFCRGCGAPVTGRDEPGAGRRRFLVAGLLGVGFVALVALVLALRGSGPNDGEITQADTTSSTDQSATSNDDYPATSIDVPVSRSSLMAVYTRGSADLVTVHIVEPGEELSTGNEVLTGVKSPSVVETMDGITAATLGGAHILEFEDAATEERVAVAIEDNEGNTIHEIGRGQWVNVSADPAADRVLVSQGLDDDVRCNVYQADFSARPLPDGLCLGSEDLATAVVATSDRSAVVVDLSTFTQHELAAPSNGVISNPARIAIGDGYATILWTVADSEQLVSYNLSTGDVRPDDAGSSAAESGSVRVVAEGPVEMLTRVEGGTGVGTTLLESTAGIAGWIEVESTGHVVAVDNDGAVWRAPIDGATAAERLVDPDAGFIAARVSGLDGVVLVTYVRNVSGRGERSVMVIDRDGQVHGDLDAIVGDASLVGLSSDGSRAVLLERGPDDDTVLMLDLPAGTPPQELDRAVVSGNPYVAGDSVFYTVSNGNDPPSVQIASLTGGTGTRTAYPNASFEPIRESGESYSVTTSAGGTTFVAIDEGRFNPSNLKASLQERPTVVWVNFDLGNREYVIEDRNGTFISPVLQFGDIFTFDFEGLEPALYRYSTMIGENRIPGTIDMRSGT